MSQDPNFVQVFYFVPEDGDDVNHPNCLLLPRTSVSSFGTIDIEEIEIALPLPGAYHFRLRKQLNHNRSDNHSEVWIDIEKGSEIPVPISSGIFLKATRLSWKEEQIKPTRKKNRLTVRDIHKNSFSTTKTNIPPGDGSSIINQSHKNDLLSSRDDLKERTPQQQRISGERGNTVGGVGGSINLL